MAAGKTPLHDVHPDHDDFLRDESRVVGSADAIAFPASEEEIVSVLAEAAARGQAVTIQGGRTGITAGAVPRGGLILNLSRMRRVLGMRLDAEAGRFFVTIEPGLLLSDLRAAIRAGDLQANGWDAGSVEAARILPDSGEWFFPPDPTETTASVGGMVACNASGSLTFHYGPTRRYVHGLRIALADGNSLHLRRGQHRAKGRTFELTCEGGRTIRGVLPAYTMPQVKNAAGYYAEDDMDLVDLFIGGEGTLGVITEIELELIRAPSVRWGVMAFLPSEKNATTFVRLVRGDPVSMGGAVVRTRPVAVEFFDERALDLLRRRRNDYAVLAGLPEVKPGCRAAVYVEYHGTDESAVMTAIEGLVGIIDSCEGSEDATWTATDDAGMQRLKDFRHAVPEIVNLLIDERRKKEPRLTKLGTDMAVPNGELERVIALYHEALDSSGLEYLLFGHIGNNHIHVNILPRDMQDYEKGKAIYLGWAREVIRMGGTISAEHGVGKLKVDLLREMYGEAGIAQMREVKKAFDPEQRLNPGNLF